MGVARPMPLVVSIRSFALLELAGQTPGHVPPTPCLR
jgi:hypothetical protein